MVSPQDVFANKVLAKASLILGKKAKLLDTDIDIVKGTNPLPEI